MEEAVPFAAAVEMIHAYSLIHDDLPCMDDDDLRRGKPTNHKVFGEAMAVLSGDGLQSLAYETMLSHGYKENAWKAAGAVAQGAGSMGMVSGQVRDMQATGQEVSADTLRRIHAEKTGALILAACLAGAYMAGAKAQEIESITSYAKALGLAFQIADDILDVTSTAEELGKTPGKDEKEHKTTYVSLYGLERAQQLAEQAAEQAQQALGHIVQICRALGHGLIRHVGHHICIASIYALYSKLCRVPVAQYFRLHLFHNHFIIRQIKVRVKNGRLLDICLFKALP